jgi:hypothetical protein
MTPSDTTFWISLAGAPFLLVALAYVALRWHERTVDRERARGTTTPAE